MRITAVYEDARMPLDVNPEDCVGLVKGIVKKRMVLETMEDKKVGKYLELRFGGAPLHEEWVLQDIAITSGSVIKCALKTVERPKLKVFLAYNQEVLLLTQDIDPISLKVGELRAIISAKLGIPVSIFRLSFDPREDTTSSVTRQRSESESKANNVTKIKELFDTNTLYYYGIDIGSKIRLDLWDGWNELILTAIAGHEKVTPQYFSWERPVRHFQHRVCLYIASFFGHMGLATAMMKYGAKPYEPVGIHPTRKWCYESEHPESRKCPLHVACTKGHLPILRLFVKSSPLCFITKDEKDRTPLQIVLRHRYRACFEFLIARQWGRKSGKDFSFSLTLYCRIIQWCERAKARTLLMLGTGKSTFRGVPPKKGALVGTAVLVDGYSDKPANSVPFALVPKPEVPPEKMLSAIALTKRRLRALRRRQSSSRSMSRRDSTISTASNSRRERLTSAGTAGTSGTVNSTRSYASFDRNSLPPTNKFSHERELLSNGNLRASQKLSKEQDQEQSKLSNTSKIAKNGKPSRIVASSKNSVSPPTQNESKNSVTLPWLPTRNRANGNAPKKLSRRDSRISFKPEQTPLKRSRDCGKKAAQSQIEFASRTSMFVQPAPAVERVPAPVKAKVPETGIPLPSKSLESQLKPFFYWSPRQPIENPVQQTMKRFDDYRGIPSRQHAVQCLAVTSSFAEKPWLQQLRMAVCLTRRGVKKRVEVLPQQLVAEC